MLQLLYLRENGTIGLWKFVEFHTANYSYLDGSLPKLIVARDINGFLVDRLETDSAPFGREETVYIITETGRIDLGRVVVRSDNLPNHAIYAVSSSTTYPMVAPIRSARINGEVLTLRNKQDERRPVFLLQGQGLVTNMKTIPVKSVVLPRLVHREVKEQQKTWIVMY